MPWPPEALCRKFRHETKHNRRLPPERPDCFHSIQPLVAIPEIPGTMPSNNNMTPALPSVKLNVPTREQLRMENELMKKSLATGAEFKRLLEHMFADKAVEADRSIEQYRAHFIKSLHKFKLYRSVFDGYLSPIEGMDDCQLNNCDDMVCSLCNRDEEPASASSSPAASTDEMEVSVVKQNSPSTLNSEPTPNTPPLQPKDSITPNDSSTTQIEANITAVVQPTPVTPDVSNIPVEVSKMAPVTPAPVTPDALDASSTPEWPLIETNISVAIQPTPVTPDAPNSPVEANKTPAVSPIPVISDALDNPSFRPIETNKPVAVQPAPVQIVATAVPCTPGTSSTITVGGNKVLLLRKINVVAKNTPAIAKGSFIRLDNINEGVVCKRMRITSEGISVVNALSSTMKIANVSTTTSSSSLLAPIQPQTVISSPSVSSPSSAPLSQTTAVKSIPQPSNSIGITMPQPSNVQKAINIKCPIFDCFEVFSSYTAREEHYKSHTKLFKCSKCTMLFNKKQQVYKHFRVHSTIASIKNEPIV